MMWHGKNFRGIINKAKQMIFDNTGTDLISTNAEDAIKEVYSNLTWEAWHIETGYSYRKNALLTQVRINGPSTVNPTITAIGTLPTGYRPSAKINQSIYANGTGNFCFVNIDTNGLIAISNDVTGVGTTITF